MNPRFEYFTVAIGLYTEGAGEIDRGEVFAALRDQIIQEMILDDTGIMWGVYSVKDES